MNSAYLDLSRYHIYFERKILNFGIKFAQNGHLSSKKVKIPIEICIFELV